MFKYYQIIFTIFVSALIVSCGNDVQESNVQTTSPAQKEKDKTFLEAVYCAGNSKMLASIIPSAFPSLNKWAAVFGEISITSRSDAISKASDNFNSVDDEIDSASMKSATYLMGLGSEAGNSAVLATINDTFSKCSNYASEQTLKAVINS